MAQWHKVLAFVWYFGLCLFVVTIDSRGAVAAELPIAAVGAASSRSLQTTGALQGTVVALDVKEIRLSLMAADNSLVASQVVSGREGSYLFADLAAGTYYLGVQLVDFNDAPFKLMGQSNIVVTAGQYTTVDFWDWLNPALGVIAGVVTAPDGTPLAGMQVEASSATYHGYGTTNSGGAYQLGNLYPGLYTLQFSDPAGRYLYEFYDNQSMQTTAQRLTIAPGTILKKHDAMLTVGGAISGQVRLANGSALERVEVRAYRHTGAEWELAPVYSTGNFVISGLPTGRYRLAAQGYLPQPDRPYADYQEYYHNASTIERATDIEVTAGVTVTDIVIQLGDELEAVLIDGPVAGNVDTAYTFRATVSPAYAGQPITYTWYPNDPAPDQAVTQRSGISDTVLLRWSTPGVKSIRVVADNGQGAVESNRYQVAIDATTGVQLETVHVLGGNLRATAGNGPYLYRGVGPTLVIVDVSSPNHPLVAGESTSFPDAVADLAYAGGYLYVAAGSAGVRVVDVTRPLSPREVGQYTGVSAAAQIALTGRYAFVLDEQAGLVILDVANPAQPRLVGTFAEYTGTELVIDDQVALIVSNEIVFLDVRNPTLPVLAGRYQASKIGTLAVLDGYLYLSDQLTSCRIINIKNPKAPTEVGSCGNPWHEIKIHGRYLYTNGFSTPVGYQDGVWVYDLANPAAPTYVARYGAEAGQFTDLYVTDAVVVASNLTQGVVVIAVANQPQPFIAGSLSTLTAAGGELVIQGNTGYLLDRSFHILDLSQPAQLVELGRLTLLYWGYTNQQMVVNGNLALVVAGERLLAIDVTNPRQPKQRALYSANDFIEDVAMAGKYIYLLVGQQDLVVFDASNVYALTPVATLNLSTSAQILTVQGQYAYLGGNDALQIVRLTNPLTPLLVANLPSFDYVDVLQVDGSRLYTLERTQRWNNATRYFNIYDLANPVAPVFLGQYGPDLFHQLLVTQQRAYLATSQNQIQVVDVSDPVTPLPIGKTLVSGANTMALRTPYLYVTSETLGLAVLWMREAQKSSAPANQPLTFTPTPNLHYEVAADGWQLATDQAAPAAVKLIHAQAYGTLGALPSGRTMIGESYQLQAVDAGSGQAVIAAKPYIVQLHYDAETIATVDEASLAIYYQAQGQWLAADMLGIDTTQRWLRARLPALTTWALFGAAKPGTPGRQVFLPIVIRPAFDAQIANLELTQAIQTLQNDVPLVAGRPVVARIYATTDSNSAINGFQLIVTATRDGVPLPGSPLTIGLWAIFPQPARDQLSNTFNVPLPLAWAQGHVRLTAQLQPPANQRDRNPSNNQKDIELTFHDVPALDIKVVPINYTHQPTGQRYAAPTSEQFSDYVMRLYPIHALQLSMRAPIDFTGDLGTDDGWSKLIQLIATVKQGDDAPKSQIYYGILTEGDFDSKWGGMGSGGRYSVSFNDGSIVAHELGHNLRRQHAPCGNPGGIDPDYPYANASIGEYGFDLTAFAILAPATTVDMMSYCGPDWVSDYTYRALFGDQRLHGVRAAALPSTPSVLLRADLTAGQAPSLQPLYFYPGAPSSLPAASAYTAHFLGAARTPLITYPLPLEVAEEDGFAARFINALLPLPDQAVYAIQLRYQDQVIAERVLLTETVQAATSYQIEQETTGLTLHWQPNTQPVLVRYTNNNGQSWITLAVDAIGGELHLMSDWLPGGAGRFAILPADLPQPVLTAAAVQALALPDRAPRAWITGPNTIRPGAPLILFGYGDDPEEGALTNLHWTINGQSVAAGHTLQLDTVSAGSQLVSLTVMDRAGHQVTATHQVLVLE